MVNHNKKGSLTTIIYIILAIVSFLFVTTLVVKGMNRDYIDETQICKATLLLDAKTNSIPYISSELNAKCRTIPIEDLRTFQREDQIKRFIANRMAEAWNMVHEGRVKELWTSKGFGAAGYNCFVVFDIDFTDPAYKTNISAENLTEYFITEEHPEKEISYHQYVNTYGGDGMWIFGEDLEPGYHYAISVRSPHDAQAGKNKWIDRMIQNPGKTAILTVTGVNSIIKRINRFKARVAKVSNLFLNKDDLNTILIFSSMDYALDPQGLACDYGS